MSKINNIENNQIDQLFQAFAKSAGEDLEIQDADKKEKSAYAGLKNICKEDKQASCLAYFADGKVTFSEYAAMKGMTLDDADTKELETILKSVPAKLLAKYGISPFIEFEKKLPAEIRDNVFKYTIPVLADLLGSNQDSFEKCLAGILKLAAEIKYPTGVFDKTIPALAKLMTVSTDYFEICVDGIIEIAKTHEKYIEITSEAWNKNKGLSLLFESSVPALGNLMSKNIGTFTKYVELLTTVKSYDIDFMSSSLVSLKKLLSANKKHFDAVSTALLNLIDKIKASDPSVYSSPDFDADWYCISGLRGAIYAIAAMKDIIGTNIKTFKATMAAFENIAESPTSLDWFRSQDLYTIYKTIIPKFDKTLLADKKSFQKIVDIMIDIESSGDGLNNDKLHVFTVLTPACKNSEDLSKVYEQLKLLYKKYRPCYIDLCFYTKEKQVTIVDGKENVNTSLKDSDKNVMSINADIFNEYFKYLASHSIVPFYLCDDNIFKFNNLYEEIKDAGDYGVTIVKDLIKFIDDPTISESTSTLILKYTLPALKQFVTPKNNSFLKLLDAMKTMVKATGPYEYVLFKKGIPALEGKINNLDQLKILVTFVNTFKYNSPQLLSEMKGNIDDFSTDLIKKIIDDEKSIGINAVYKTIQKVNIDVNNAASSDISYIDIDGNDVSILLDKGVVNYKIGTMEAYAFRRRGFSIKVPPLYAPTHKVVVYNKNTLVGIFDIPPTGNINDIELIMPKSDSNLLQIYLVKNIYAKDYLSLRKNKSPIKADGAAFFKIDEFEFIETKIGTSMSWIFDNNGYDQQYFYDSANVDVTGTSVDGAIALPDAALFGNILQEAVGDGSGLKISQSGCVYDDVSAYKTKLILKTLAKMEAVADKFDSAEVKTFAKEYAKLFSNPSQENFDATTNMGENEFSKGYKTLISGFLIERQALENATFSPEIEKQMKAIESLLSISQNMDNYTNEYYNAAVSEMMFTANLLSNLFPAALPPDFMQANEQVLAAKFEKAVENNDGSFDLKYIYKTEDKGEQKVVWKNVFPGTLILRPLQGLPLQASYFPGDYEHGIMFIGVNEAGFPMAISHPGGIGLLTNQISGKNPAKVKFVQPTNDVEIMKKAVKAVKYLWSKNPKFDMFDPSLPFNKANKIETPGGEFPYYYQTMYCFMMIVKAYELAGYDISNINEYELDYNKVLSLNNASFVSKATILPGIIGSMTVDDKEEWGKMEILEKLGAMFDAPDFPGLGNANALSKFLLTQDYKLRYLLISLLYYTGDEILNGKGVKDIEGKPLN